MSPQEMDARFTAEDVADLWRAFGAPDPLSASQEASLAKLREILPKLPAIELDILERHYLRGVSQRTLGSVFGMSQPSIHHRIQRARQRIHYWMARPDLSSEDLRAALSPHFDDLDVEIMVLVAETTSQLETGRRIGRDQSYVRSRMLRTLKRVDAQRIDPCITELFELIRANPNIARDRRSTCQGRSVA